MNTYTYTISIVFSAGVDTSKLQEEINANVNISDCSYIDTVDDEIYLYFTLTLSGAEITTLESIMVAHVLDPPQLTLLSAVIVPVKLDSTNNTTYTKFGSYTYLGNIRERTLKAVYFVGYMDVGVTNYSVRIFNVTNNTLIVEKTFTNTAELSLDMGVVANVPTGQATLEMQLRKNGGSNNQRVYVNSISLYV